MVLCMFTRENAKVAGPDVLFTCSDETEVILVADDWRNGYEKSLRKEDYSETGYIGRGSAKQVIYVCFVCVSVYWKNIYGSLTG
jgi:hypothetical protein